MFQLFGSLKTFVKPQSVVIDNGIFRLHYRITTTLLVAFSLMVTAHQFFGDPIDCLTKREVPASLLDTYCWLHSTFSIESAWEKEVGVEIPYPGVDNSNQAEGSESKRVYHTYYQWVCWALFGQAIAFYLPHYFWKSVEGSLLKNLLLGLEKPILKPNVKEENLTLLAEYLVRARGSAYHQKLYLCYVISELLNLLNVLTQMVLLDRLLGGEFFAYGWEVLAFRQEMEITSSGTWPPLQYSPLVRLFPRVAKCEFYQFGPSAGIEKFDTMCLLSINILSEKVYLLLWVWFHVLTFLTSTLLLYRLITTICPPARRFLLHLHVRTLSRARIEAVLRESANLGDWMLLRLLAKNMHTLHFHDLMLLLEEKVKLIQGEEKISKKVELVVDDDDKVMAAINNSINLHHSD